MHIGIIAFILIHLHLTTFEPIIKDAIKVAENPTVQKEAKAIIKSYKAHHHKGKRP